MTSAFSAGRMAATRNRLSRLAFLLSPGSLLQAVLAVYLNNNRDGLGLSGIEDYKSVKIGSLSIETAGASSTASGADRVPPIFERYLTGLRISGPGNVSIRRS